MIVGIEGVDAIVLCSDDKQVVSATCDAHSRNPKRLCIYRTIDCACCQFSECGRVHCGRSERILLCVDSVLRDVVVVVEYAGQISDGNARGCSGCGKSYARGADCVSAAGCRCRVDSAFVDGSQAGTAASHPIDTPAHSAIAHVSRYRGNELYGSCSAYDGSLLWRKRDGESGRRNRECERRG